jgi:hypothetical protein
LVCIAHAAIACCMVLESWMTCAMLENQNVTFNASRWLCSSRKWP